MKKHILLIGLLGLTACTQSPFEFRGNNGAGAGAGTNGQNFGTGAMATPAYFNQSIGDRVLFGVDQYTLSDAAKAVLSQQAAWLQQNPNYNITVEGHADEQGTREYNLALGARRAQSVQDYLVSLGIDTVRIKSLSFGKERPLEICSRESCYSKNRRAVTVLAGGVG